MEKINNFNNCIFLGAGISNLVTAFELPNKIRKEFIEKNAFTGGRIQTLKFNDTVIEVGAQFFSNDDLNVFSLLERLSLKNQLKEVYLSSFRIIRDNNVFSFSSNKSLNEKEVKELALFYEKLEEMNSEFFEKNILELESITLSEWLNNNIGFELSWFFKALTKSITFSLPNELNAFYGLIVVKTFFDKTFTLNEGLQLITKNLMNKSSAVFRFNSIIKKINFNDSMIESIELQDSSELIKTKNSIVVSCLPAQALASKIDNKELSSLLSKIKYKSSITSYFILNEKIKKLEGFLLPYNESIITALYVFPLNKSSSGMIVFSLFEDNLNQTINEIKRELLKLHPSLSSNIIAEKHFEWPYALPVASTSLPIIQTKLSELSFQNFFLNGDFLGLPSLDAAIESGFNTAKKIKQLL